MPVQLVPGNENSPNRCVAYALHPRVAMHGHELDRQTFQIIGAAMEVHRQLHRGLYELFYSCFDSVIVDVKAVSALTPADEAQLLSYLAMTGMGRGLLINVGTKSLDYKRRVM